MIKPLVLIGVLIAAVSGCAYSTHSTRLPFENPSLDRITSDRLEQFGSNLEFYKYLREVQRIAEAEHRRLYADRPIRLAQLSAQANTMTDACIEEDCPEEDEARRQESITVTASKASNPSITNNQEVGVEEGDIVKQIDDFLIVLQDGRLFSVNTKPGGAEGLALAGRQDVYLSEEVDTWYDEMLVSGNKIIVTGYSYSAEASEVAIFTLNRNGSFAREDTFYISSDDYYDSDNYATRIVDDKFIVHTPIYLSGYDPTDALPWPVLRHWDRLFDIDQVDDWSDLPSNSLLRPRDIYRPVQGTISPVVHTITICEIGAHRRNEMLECDAQAFIAPEGYEFYVSPEDVYLWTWPDGDDWDQRWDRDTTSCKMNERVPRNKALPSVVYKIPIDGTRPEVLKATGRPFDQFSIVSKEDRFHALIDWTDPRCEDYAESLHPTLLSAPIRAFSSVLNRARFSVEELPAFPSDYALENRFVGEKLIYSTSDDWGHYPPSAGTEVEPASVLVLSVSEPKDAVLFQAPHSAIRLEALGEDAIVTGYADETGLSISAISLGATSRLISTITLEDRFESEGRSHAFNAMISIDGGALMGIPTVERPESAGRWWWHSEDSDLSFLSASEELNLSSLGTLNSSDASSHDTYDCEVSCVDWYGNSRPIFTSGRIFALSGTELIEGQIIDDRISAKRRVDMTAPIAADP